MKITTKGQVTIPLHLRDKLGFHPHTEIEFVEKQGRVYLEKRTRKQTRGERVVGLLRGKAQVRMTTDQIMQLTRGR